MNIEERENQLNSWQNEISILPGQLNYTYKICLLCKLIFLEKWWL